MKKTNSVIITFVITLAFGFASITTYAHDDEHVEDEVFDPVENEFGSYDPELEVTRTIEIEMNDQMRFSPELIKVKKGEVIKFVHTNVGQVMHEFVLGTPDSLAEHAEMMKKFPGMEHSEPYMAHVAPRKKGVIIWKFSQAGEFAFGCLIPGHFDAGMKGKVLVTS